MSILSTFMSVDGTFEMGLFCFCLFNCPVTPKLALNLGDFFPWCFKMRFHVSDGTLYLHEILKYLFCGIFNQNMSSWSQLVWPGVAPLAAVQRDESWLCQVGPWAHCVNFKMQSPKMSTWRLSAQSLSYWLYYLVHFYFKGEFYWGWLYQK